MGSLSSFNRVKYLLSAIDFSAKYAWVKPLKDKKAKTILHAVIEIVNKSKREANKLWIDQGKEFYNSFMQKWLTITTF